MLSKSYSTMVVRVIIFLQILIGYSIFNISAAATSCGVPSYNRATDDGLYLWQLCGSNQWFMRAVGGGRATANELRVEGRLTSDQAFPSVIGFSLEPGDPLEQFPEPDFVNKSDPKDIKFRFRVWSDAQDGMDFSMPASASACLKISVPANMSVFVGRTKAQVNPPFLLGVQINGNSCGSILPGIKILLLD